jgi:hypothetical protein
MERADNAVSKRDDAILNLKKLEIENKNLKIEINDTISKNSITEKKPIINYHENKSLVLPTIGLASIIFGLIIGKR